MESDLTPRQLQILRMRATGMPVKAVAGVLGIRENTAKNLCLKAYYRLDVSGFIEAINKLGWVRVS